MSTPSNDTRPIPSRAARTAAILAAHFPMLVATLTAQTVVESANPSGPDLTLSDEPLVRIGVLDGPMEHMFGEIAGAIRLEDGSVVVVDGQSNEARMFDAGGRHVWTSSLEVGSRRQRDSRALRLLRGCPEAPISVLDVSSASVTELDPNGNVTETRKTVGFNPYSEVMCSPDGELVVASWPETEFEWESLTAGDIFRSSRSLKVLRSDTAIALVSGIPGTEHVYNGMGAVPRRWGKDMVFAATGTGLWYGSGDDYELEHVDWSGRVTRIARWSGPDLDVTAEHLDRYMDSYLALFDTPRGRQAFERELWPGMRDGLPERFPAFETEAAGLMALPDGSLWVTIFGWRAPDQELHLLQASGAWAGRLVIPAGPALLDAGPGWVLLLERGEFDEQRVAVYELVEAGGSG